MQIKPIENGQKQFLAGTRSEVRSKKRCQKLLPMLASLNSMHEKLSYKMLHLRQLSLWSLEEDKGRDTLLGEDNNTKVGIILLVESSVHKT